jgi:hypothetical protein
VRALLALVAALATPDVVAPPVVDWREAGERAGQVVTVEGDVRAAECSEDRCLLEFAPEDPRGFRVVVLMPIFARATDAPDAAYRGRRIRATGKIQRFQGRVEMVLRGTGQIALADTEAAPAVATPSTTRPTAPPPTAPPVTILPPAPPPTAPPATVPPPAPEATRPPATLPQAAPAAPPPPAPTVTPPTATPPPARVEAPPPPPPPAPREEGARAAASCEQAKARWRETATDVRTHTTSLERCMRALPYRCHPESAALAAVLPLLDAAERQVDEACR